MEQLVARRAHNPKVVGSSPAPATQKVKSLKSKDLRLFCLGYFKLKACLLPTNCKLAVAVNRASVTKKSLNTNWLYQIRSSRTVHCQIC
jgi:hypothetical protein